MNKLIELQNVCVRHGATTVLQEISLSLDAGAFLAVLGPNGAGKTSLLNVVAGFAACTGAVRVLGAEVSLLSAWDRARKRCRIGYVPQLHTRPQAVLPLSVREVVAMGRSGRRGIGRRLTAMDEQVCDRVLEQMELVPLANRPYGVLSGGEQRKVQLARALAQEPEILLLDEPAGHLDFRWQEQIAALIDAVWRDAALTVIMVTHDPRHLPAAMTHVALMAAGRITRWGSPDECLDGPSLSALYQVPLKRVAAGGRYVVLPEVPSA